MSLPLRLLRRVLLQIERRLYAASARSAPLPVNKLAAEQVRSSLRELDIEGRDYLELHLDRLVHTIQRVPPAQRSGAEVLEIGSYGHVSAICNSSSGIA